MNWGGSSLQSSETRRSMKIIPVRNLSLILACCEIKGHSIWEGNLWHWNHGSHRKEYSGGGRERLWALLQSRSSSQCDFILSIHGFPCFTMEVPHKDPFCPHRHRSHVFSVRTVHKHLRRENTNKGKMRLGHGENDEVPEEETNFPRSGRSSYAKSHRAFVSLNTWHRGCDWVNEVLYSHMSLEVRTRDTRRCYKQTKWPTVLEGASP